MVRVAGTVCVAFAAFACASSPPVRPAASSATRRTDIIGQDEIRSREWNNAYEMIAALRGNWLQERGPDSFALTSEIQVLVDGMRLGGVDMLRSHPVGSVVRAQYYDPIAAAARFGLMYNKGAIELFTASGVTDKKP